MERETASRDSFKRYLASRKVFVERMAEVTQQLTEWTDEHRETPPSLMDVARFEGIRAERSRLLAEFGDREDRFVVELLEGQPT
jgi:hypothetical protein